MQKILSHLTSFFALSQASKKWVPVILVIFSVALLIRAGFFFYFLENDRGLFYDGDSSGYTGPVINILLGNGFAVSEHQPYQPESFRTPGYSVFLLFHYVLFGGFLSALFTQILLALFTAFIALKIADEYFKIEWGIIATAIFLFSPFSVLASLQLTPFVLFSALLALAVWFVLSGIKTGKISFLYGAAVILPVLAFVRPIALFILVPFFGAIAIAWAWERISPGKLVHFSVILFFVFLAGVTPWFYRNYAVFGYFSFSSLPAYQLYFFEDVAFHAIANNQSFAESRKFFEDHISEVTGKPYETYRRKYIEFSALTPQLSEEAFKFAIMYPFAVVEARIRQFGDFFVRDGIRYWFERFDTPTEPSPGFALTLYEKGAYPEHRAPILIEQALNLVIALGFFAALLYGVARKNFAPVLLGLLVLYFALLSGVASSASYRYQAEPFLTLLGIIGIYEMWSSVKRHSTIRTNGRINAKV